MAQQAVTRSLIMAIMISGYKGSYVYGGFTSLVPNNLFNPDFSWEINKS